MVEHKKAENFETRLLKHFSIEEGKGVAFAYNHAQKAHRKEVRDTGVSFIGHPIGVVWILLEECKIKNPSIIEAAFLHDAFENTADYGTAKDMTYAQLVKNVRNKVVPMCGEDTAKMIINVSRYKGTDMRRKKSELNEMYYKKLKAASPESQLVKLADVLNNMRNPSPKVNKQKRKVVEVEEKYLPILKNVIKTYPKEGSYLIEGINKAISKWGQEQLEIKSRRASYTHS